MQEPDTATELFFEGHGAALPLYMLCEERLLATFPNTRKRVQKTQITFVNRHVFACVSFARVKRKTEMPSPYLVITLGLPYPLESERVAVKTELIPADGRRTSWWVPQTSLTTSSSVGWRRRMASRSQSEVADPELRASAAFRALLTSSGPNCSPSRRMSTITASPNSRVIRRRAISHHVSCPSGSSLAL